MFFGEFVLLSEEGREREKEGLVCVSCVFKLEFEVDGNARERE